MDTSASRKKGVSLSMINMMVSLFFGLVYTPFLLRNFGQSEYGVYSLAKSVIAFLTIMDLGFGNALIRYSARMRAQKKDVKDLYGMFLIFYSVIALIALIIGLVLMFNIESFFETSFTPDETHTLRIVFSILLTSTIITFPTSIFSSIIRSHQRFTWINGMTLCSNLLTHAVNFVFIILGYKSIAVSLVTLVFTCITAICNAIYSKRILKIKFGFKKFDKVFYKEIFLYSSFILINMVVDQLYANTDNIILGKLCGSIAVAVYGVGITFQTYFVQFSTSISSVYLPHISELSTQKDGIKKMSDTFLKVGHFQFLLLSFIASCFFVFGKSFIELWAGSGYEDAYYITLIIMIPSIIPLSQNIGISILQALNRHNIRSIMYLCIAVFNVALSIPLAIKFQGIGAAIGTATGNLLGQILFMNFFYWKKIGIDIPSYWKQNIMTILKTIPVAVVFWLINKFVYLYGWSGFAIKAAICVAIAMPYYYFFVANNSEKNLILNVFRKVIKRNK